MVQKRNEAKTLAELLAGFSGNPAIIFVVQCGIIAAWAYVESILDLRALLRGDKIALIKSDRQWTTNTKHLLESSKDDAKAINCENGLTYKQYIKQFVITMGNQKLAYRMMDVMEQNVRAVSGNEAVRMDDMVCRIKVWSNMERIRYLQDYPCLSQYVKAVFLCKGTGNLTISDRERRAGISWCLIA